MNQPTLFSAEMATLARDIHQLAQLGFAVYRGVLQGRLQPNQTAQRGSSAVEDPEWPLKNFGKYLQWPCCKQSKTLGALERKHFWHQLPHHNVQKSNPPKSANNP